MYGQKKQQISHYAIKPIPYGASVYLDAGKTVLVTAKNIAHRTDLIVVSNDLVIAACLMALRLCQQIPTSGVVCRENNSCVATLATKI